MKFLLAVFLTLGGLVFAETEFAELSLSADDQLIFRARTQSPSVGESSSHFLMNLNSGEMDALSFIPEGLTYLSQTGHLQMQNRFGLFRFQPGSGGVEIISRETFLKGTPVTEGKLLPILASPDGNWLIFQFPNDLIRGDLILYETQTRKSTTISGSMLLGYREVPALWSLDSQFFVYSREGSLFYFSLRQLRENRVPGEVLRNLGRGSIQGAAWGQEGALFIAQEKSIYRILPEEFFTLSLYGGLFRTGGIQARLPHPFDPNRDQFWLSPDRQWVLFNMGGRSLFLYPFNNLDFYLTTDAVTSYLPMPGGMRVHRAVWTLRGGAAVLVSSLQAGKEIYEVLHVQPKGITRILGPQTEPIKDILLSPQSTRTAILTQTGASIRSVETWAELGTVVHPESLYAVWRGEDNLVIGGRYQTTDFNVKENTSATLLLGQLDQVGFDAENRVLARQGEKIFEWKGKGLWEEKTGKSIMPALLINTVSRVYTEDLAGGPYRNMVYVRNLRSFGTRAVLSAPQRNYEPFPSQEETTSRDIFTNGSRLRTRQVTLVIDAEDDDEDISEVLRIFKEYGFKTTLFVGGEFLRRNPGAVREMGSSPHELGSLFNLSFNMGDPRFVIERDFIRRGLARMEDDYNALTTKELSLIWHAPGYFLSTSVIQGGKDANYLYISRDVDLVARGRRVDTIRLLEQILQSKKPGSIIPLPLGLTDEKTGESFFRHLDVLLNALVVQGYRIVPVSAQRESVR